MNRRIDRFAVLLLLPAMLGCHGSGGNSNADPSSNALSFSPMDGNGSDDPALANSTAAKGDNAAQSNLSSAGPAY